MLVQSSFVKKFSASFIAGITTVALILMLGNGGNIPWFPAEIVFPLAGVVLLLSLVFPIYWHAKEKPTTAEHSAELYTRLYDIIRYCLAFNVASFGWKKIFGLQFIVPAEIASQPMNIQSGEWLTWYYFGYSFMFGIIVAMLQLGGALLLLFRRTQLFGVFILLGVMLNLTLINIFYGMNAGALVQSVIITLGLLFLLLPDYRKIIDFFFSVHSTGGVVSKPIGKNILRLTAILLSFLFTLYMSKL